MERASQSHFTYRAASYWPQEANEPAGRARRRSKKAGSFASCGQYEAAR
jgi:hypothetical protein